MDQALKTMIENMPDKTGKSIEEWKKIYLDKAISIIPRIENQQILDVACG
ncbi:MAG: hypothetical protein PF484_04115 [Bacteroidales bacterium]|jgi:hypothetical protein|nr:hypothetical protein [Bacteroidales bacterium]